MNIAVLHSTKRHGSVDTDEYESYPHTDGAMKTWWVVDHCPAKAFSRKVSRLNVGHGDLDLFLLLVVQVFLCHQCAAMYIHMFLAY